MAYGQCQRLVCSLTNKTNSEQLTTFENMLAGSFGSIFSSLVLCPTELVKCRLQTLNDMPLSKTSNYTETQRRKIT
jgi:solute carrier family 25 ornithine transporter 2/15